MTEFEQRGNTERAIYYYGKLVDLWKDAWTGGRRRWSPASLIAKLLHSDRRQTRRIHDSIATEAKEDLRAPGR